MALTSYSTLVRQFELANDLVGVFVGLMHHTPEFSESVSEYVHGNRKGFESICDGVRFSSFGKMDPFDKLIYLSLSDDACEALEGKKLAWRSSNDLV
jgi:hypothetical protein